MFCRTPCILFASVEFCHFLKYSLLVFLRSLKLQFTVNVCVDFDVVNVKSPLYCFVALSLSLPFLKLPVIQDGDAQKPKRV